MAVLHPVQMQSGLGPYAPLRHAPEAASQSYVVGSPVIRSSGKLAVSADNPTAATFLGFAAAAATGTTSTDRVYNHCPVGGIIVASLDDAYSGSDAPLTHALAATDLFIRCGFGIDGVTKKAFLIDSATSNNVLFDIIGLVDAIGTVCGRVEAIRVV